MYFIICSIILGFCLTAFIWSAILYDNHQSWSERLGVIGMLGMIGIILFGFLIIPFTGNGYEKIYYSKNFKWLKSATAIYVEYPNQLGDTVRLGPYTDVDTWNNIQNMRLKVIKSWDYYGYKNQSQVSLVK